MPAEDKKTSALQAIDSTAPGAEMEAKDSVQPVTASSLIVIDGEDPAPLAPKETANVSQVVATLVVKLKKAPTRLLKQSMLNLLIANRLMKQKTSSSQAANTMAFDHLTYIWVKILILVTDSQQFG